jgi:hypothetical protein
MSARRFFRLPVQEIGYVRAIIEGYDGLAYIWAPDPNRGEIEWILGEGRDAEVDDLVARLGREVGLTEIDRPLNWPCV